MTGDEIVKKVKSLNFPKDSYVVYGSGPLAAAGIRESQDVDFLVSEELFKELRKNGWKKHYKNENDEPLVHNVFEAHSNWDFSPYSPTLVDLLKTATITQGVPFASLVDVRKWKELSGRPKDIVDVKLIDDYLKKQNH